MRSFCRESPVPWLLFLATLIGCAGSHAVVDLRGGLGANVASPRYHYRLELSDPSWQRVRPGSFSPTADLALEHDRGEALLLVFAEPAGCAGLDDYMRRSRGIARMDSSLGASWTSAETTEVIGTTGRFPGWIIEQHIDRAVPLDAYALVTVADGVGYHVLCWGSARNPELHKACIDAVRGFRPIQQSLGQPIQQSLRQQIRQSLAQPALSQVTP